MALASDYVKDNSEFVSYYPDPDGRGTVALVLSCLLTLLLCVWQALHLNVPIQGETAPQCVMENIRWIIAGIYAPELVVFAAWRQWSSARLLSQTVSGIQREEFPKNGSDRNPEDSKNPHCYPWTRTHSFFASTGGFAFEIPPSSQSLPFLPAGCPSRLTVTARGMALLARCGRLPNVPEEDILDKSKANGLAKLLVMAQASWMLLQCIGRLYARLPVTLLEVNTVAHVLCALLMYALWWHKPLLAKEPIIIRGEWVEPLCAFMLMSSEMSGNVDETSIESETVVKSLFASLHLYSRTPEIDLVAFCDGDENMGTMQMDTGNDAQLKKGQSIYTVKQSSSDCREAVQRRKLDTPDQTAFFERRPKIKATPHQGTPIANTTARRWNLATIAIHRYRTILESHVLLRHQRGTCIHFKPEELLAHRIQNWPWDDLLRNVGGLMVGMILWFSNLCYGGLHAAAWNDHFPSHAEKWLWRTSPLYIGFCGGLWICLNWLTLRCRPLNEFWERWMDGEKRWWSNIGIGLLVAVCGGALCAARCFIVVEAFVSIRSLPSSAYETPKWSQILPHF